MSSIVHETLDVVWVLYGICGAGMVTLSTIYIVDEEIFMYVAMVYGILGIILLIISKYNKPTKSISFEDEFREDLYNLERLTGQQQLPTVPTADPGIVSGNQQTDSEQDSGTNGRTDDATINTIMGNIKTKHAITPKLEINQNQSFEAFTTSATNGLYM